MGKCKRERKYSKFQSTLDDNGGPTVFRNEITKGETDHTKTKKTDILKSSKKKPHGGSKRNKLMLKKQIYLQKNELVQLAKKTEKEKKKREKTVIIGDLHPLRDALPSLESLMNIRPHEIKTGIPFHENKINSKQSLKKQETRKKGKEYKQRINLFKQLLADETFKNNPREAIATHIRLTMQDKVKDIHLTHTS